MRGLANGAVSGSMGQEKIKARGAGIVWDMVDDVKRDDIVGWDIFQTNRALAVKGAMVTAGAGRVILIKRGVGRIQGVLLAADKVGSSIGVGFEGGAKSKIDDTNINSND